MYYQKTKWGNAKKSEYNGYLFDSKFEAKHAQDLDLLLNAGEIKGYDRQKNIDLIVNDFIVATYKIDFIVYHNDGTIEYQELKGYPITAVWVLKFKIFEALFSNKPDVKITLISQGKKPKLRKIKKINNIEKIA